MPKGKIIPAFGFRATALPATTAFVGSPVAGGIRKLDTGYATAAAVETKPTASSASRNVRRSKIPPPVLPEIRQVGV